MGARGSRSRIERGVARRGQELGGFEEPKLLGGGGDIEHVPAFRHHQLVVEDVAARDAAETSSGEAGRSKRYSPACSTRPRSTSRASRKSQRLRTTPACASMSAMAPVEVPRGISTKVSPCEALVGPRKPVEQASRRRGPRAAASRPIARAQPHSESR